MKDLETTELERILAGEAELEPTAGFSDRVMRSVRDEATAPPPMAFPWARFLPGFLVNLVLLVGAALWVISELDGSLPAQPFPTHWFADPQVQGLLWAAVTVVGSGALAWVASRWTAPKQEPLF